MPKIQKTPEAPKELSNREKLEARVKELGALIDACVKENVTRVSQLEAKFADTRRQLLELS